MGYEYLVFTILTVLIIMAGLGHVFHYRPKKQTSDREKTAYGLIDLTLGAWASVTLLIMGGII